MASFSCYDNSDVIVTLITTNFHLYLVQLWWQFFQIFVNDDVVCSKLGGIDPEKPYRATKRVAQLSCSEVSYNGSATIEHYLV